MNLQTLRNLSPLRVAFLAAGFVALVSAATLPFLSTSCSAQRAPADEAAAVERLRAMSRGGVMPAESVVAEIERDYAGTRAGALARVLHARVRTSAGDHAGAAALLDSRDIARHTSVADYATWLRAEALEKAGRSTEARAAYEQLAREHPESLLAREALLRASTIALEARQGAAVPVFLKKLTDADDARALLLAARGYEQSGDATRALGAYRRAYFHAPASRETDAEAAAALARLNSSTTAANAEEAIARAEGLYNAKRYAEATDAYVASFDRFPMTGTQHPRMRAGLAAYNARRNAEAISFFSGAPPKDVEGQAELKYNLARAYARAKQWEGVRSTVEAMRGLAPKSKWTMLALVEAGNALKEAKLTTDAFNYFRAAVSSFPGEAQVAGAQFELAWAAHEAKNFAESSRLLTEHLALYADRNTDYRGRAGYWAARDSERAGRMAEARVLYEAMLERYDANWYGQLAQKRLDAMPKAPAPSFAPDSMVARAAANLLPVTVAEETAGQVEQARVVRAEQLNAVGLDEQAHAELDEALRAAPASPRASLAKARIHRSYDQNVEALRVLSRTYPDYSQMEVGELTREEWDVFYPLTNWEMIAREARARSLDPYTVAGLIRQESVFSPRAASGANAYGLMQLLVPTARMMARKVGVQLPASNGDAVEALFRPSVNIPLGTQYLRDQIDRFGRIEYVAAAYNAGPGRAAAWRTSLPAEMDEWAEAVPFRETRGYVQGVVRNTLQYRRLYDDAGRFRTEVGAARTADAPLQGQHVRPRRVSNDEDDEE
ncbi:MAG TPA: transglycosylase SLT domain-containing protein [Pyrinomonadaceae bacterium]|nr:transglycosylase SLT domain-containing protein [Pyrinomonadaceae bacterium]